MQIHEACFTSMFINVICLLTVAAAVLHAILRFNIVTFRVEHHLIFWYSFRLLFFLCSKTVFLSSPGKGKVFFMSTMPGKKPHKISYLVNFKHIKFNSEKKIFIVCQMSYANIRIQTRSNVIFHETLRWKKFPLKQPRKIWLFEIFGSESIQKLSFQTNEKPNK